MGYKAIDGKKRCNEAQQCNSSGTEDIQLALIRLVQKQIFGTSADVCGSIELACFS
jgi:hypothetical protein